MMQLTRQIYSDAKRSAADLIINQKQVIMSTYITKEMNNNMLPKLIQLLERVYPNCSEIVKKLTYKKEHPLHIMTVVAVENDKIIGQANIFKKQVLGGIINVGYHVDPLNRSKGIATKIVGSAIEKAIAKGYNDFHIMTAPENIAAQCVANKLGFVNIKANYVGNTLIFNKKYG